MSVVLIREHDGMGRVVGVAQRARLEAGVVPIHVCAAVSISGYGGWEKDVVLGSRCADGEVTAVLGRATVWGEVLPLHGGLKTELVLWHSRVQVELLWGDPRIRMEHF